jgi:serpin B
VADKTRGRIKKMAEALGLPDPAAATGLMNAVHFKGDWTTKFDSESTGPGEFTLPGGAVVSVPMMSRRRDFIVAEGQAGTGGIGDGGPAFLIVRLPYGEDQRFAMDVLLAEAGVSIGDFVAALDPGALQAAAAAMAEQEAYLVMPRFEPGVQGQPGTRRGSCQPWDGDRLLTRFALHRPFASRPVAEPRAAQDLHPGRRGT